jgi:hypothetical protein
LNEGVFESAVKARLDESFQGKVVRYEMKYTYPELGERDLLVSYFPIEGPSGIDRVACILQDITDRKKMEEALSKMNQKLIESEKLRTRPGCEGASRRHQPATRVVGFPTRTTPGESI